MPSARVALSLIGAAAMVHALSCGGTTRNADDAPPAQNGGATGASGGSAGNGGASSGAGGAVVHDDCEPMDAKPSGARCAGTAGYRWNGQLCEGIACSCVGSACDRLFTTMAECDQAYNECYGDQSFPRWCREHSDCALAQRACCPACATPPADAYLALRKDASSPQALGVCLGAPDAGCPECEPGTNPSIYAACIDAQCSVVDVSEFAGCQTDDDCRLVSKDCCDCGGDFSEWGVMSVNVSYVRPERCEGVGCDGCVPSDPSSTRASCEERESERGVCGLIAGLP